MADDSIKNSEQSAEKSADSSQQSGDAEDLNRLLILTKESSSIKSTASFLGRRDVEVFVSTSLQDVIDRISKGWSKFVLLSINYPHPKVDMLPQLLAQSFGAEVMVFAEQSDRKSNSRLTSSKAKQVIFGAVSGPVVLMRLRQMQRGGLTDEGSTERSAGAKTGDGEDGGGVRVSGSSGADANAIHLKGGKGKATAKDGEAMSRLMKALADDTDGVSSEDRLNLDDLESLAERARSEKTDIGLQKGKKQKGFLSVPRPNAISKAAIQEAMKSGNLTPTAEGLGAGDLKSAMQAGSGTGSKKSATQSAPEKTHDGKPRLKQNAQEEQAEKNSRESVTTDADKKSANSTPNEASKESGSAVDHNVLGKVNSDMQAVPSADELSKMTLMQRLELCARRTLFQCCGRPRDERDTLVEYRASSVLVVSTNEVTGSVLVAVGRGLFSDADMLRSIEVEFIDQLTLVGIDVGIGQLESFKLNPPSAAEEAFINAEFSAVSRSESSEVGIAFLTVVPAAPVFQETADNMIEINIDAIEPNVSLDFEVFIFLPVNQKYLRYLKQGSSISSKQSERLKDNKVSNLYLDKADKEAYRQHATVESLKKQISKKTA